MYGINKYDAELRPILSLRALLAWKIEPVKFQCCIIFLSYNCHQIISISKVSPHPTLATCKWGTGQIFRLLALRPRRHVKPSCKVT